MVEIQAALFGSSRDESYFDKALELWGELLGADRAYILTADAQRLVTCKHE